ncbi:hypothetical protein [Mesobacterium pallidum]|uniref:hypothetical protein n=1 Tax=Mesobacterium pallidum TaxID=2872037 RepID=UPI001EE23B0B|nr:hypothetical protein [Mesobacterium pallidum]
MRALVFALGALALIPQPGAARLEEVICDDTARLEQQLTTRQGAEKAAFGMRGPDALLEVWIAPRTGDWTLVQAYANGTSCIVAMGENWEMLGPSADPS